MGLLAFEISYLFFVITNRLYSVCVWYNNLCGNKYLGQVVQNWNTYNNDRQIFSRSIVIFEPLIWLSHKQPYHYEPWLYLLSRYLWYDPNLKKYILLLAIRPISASGIEKLTVATWNTARKVRSGNWELKATVSIEMTWNVYFFRN